MRELIEVGCLDTYSVNSMEENATGEGKVSVQRVKESVKTLRGDGESFLGG